VGALYLPNGNPWPGPKFEYKLAWFERLIRHARTLLDSGEAAVLAGDFNVVPTDELDIYDPKSWRKDALLQPESRAAWFRLLDQGWTDSLRTVVGDAKVFTFWDYFRRHWERDAGLRIDHLLLSPPLARALSDAGVDRWVRGRPGASDHAPTWVVLDAGGASRTRKTRGARTTSAGQASAGARTARGRNSRTGAEPRARAAGRGAVPGVATRPRVAPAGSGDAAKASSGAVKKAARKVASPGSTPEAGKATSTSARKPATKKSRAPAQAATKRAARGVPKAATRKAKRATPNAPSGKLPPESTRVVVEKTTAPPRKTAKPR
jgi:exodeoxyribonuclease-3